MTFCCQAVMHNEKLNSTFELVSTNHDRAGKLFVSTIEGKLLTCSCTWAEDTTVCCDLVLSVWLGRSLPIYGVQWHPEKNLFEWTTSEGINHSANAVAVAQYIADFLVQQGKLTELVPPSCCLPIYLSICLPDEHRGHPCIETTSDIYSHNSSV